MTWGNVIFHFLIGDMTITLDDVACLLHLSIRGRLLDHSKIKHDEAQEMMVTYLEVDLMDIMMQCERTRGAHAKFSLLEKIYGEKLELTENLDGDELQVTYHRECTLRCFLLFLVGTSIFMDKSETYVDVAYLKYLINLLAIHKWKSGAPVWYTCTPRWAKVLFGLQRKWQAFAPCWW